MASFIISDRLNRIYPLPSKRLAPDFFFQPQIYRADGESVQLPNGYYTFEYTGGPEYLTHTRELGRRSQRTLVPTRALDRSRRNSAGIRATITSTRPAVRTT